MSRSLILSLSFLLREFRAGRRPPPGCIFLLPGWPADLEALRLLALQKHPSDAAEIEAVLPCLETARREGRLFLSASGAGKRTRRTGLALSALSPSWGAALWEMGVPELSLEEGEGKSPLQKVIETLQGLGYRVFDTETEPFPEVSCLST